MIWRKVWEMPLHGEASFRVPVLPERRPRGIQNGGTVSVRAFLVSAAAHCVTWGNGPKERDPLSCGSGSAGPSHPGDLGFQPARRAPRARHPPTQTKRTKPAGRVLFSSHGNTTSRFVGTFPPRKGGAFHRPPSSHGGAYHHLPEANHGQTSDYTEPSVFRPTSTSSVQASHRPTERLRLCLEPSKDVSLFSMGCVMQGFEGTGQSRQTARREPEILFHFLVARTNTCGCCRNLDG